MLDLGFSSYSPARKPALSDRHKQNRLRRCQDKVDWTVDQWKSVVWSDESRYTVIDNDGSLRVVHKEGERYLEQHSLETHRFGKDAIMLWDCFCHQENDNLTNKIANSLATYRGYKEAHVYLLMMNLHKLNKVKT
ncbi:hypothetical protein G6F56_000210 [Rhizopus delemar]|nr:hypothetical protein G6F56_000210 [Rhizopus delemar]